MKKRTIVTICDMEYNLISDENSDYTEKVAEYVDQKMREMSAVDGMSTLDAAVLAAVNIADDFFRTVDSAENLRMQLKDYFDELSNLKDEIARMRREQGKHKPENS